MSTTVAEHPSILIVEDELIVAADLESSLRGLGYDVAGIAETAGEALALADQKQPTLVLMDIQIRGPVDGIAAAQAIRQRWRIPVVFVTANSNDQTLQRANAAGPYGYVTKPFRTRELNATILVALQQHRMGEELFSQYTWLTTMLGSLSDGVIAANADGCVQYMNPVAEKLTGWKSEDARGHAIEDIYPLRTPENTPVAQCQLRDALLSRSAVSKRPFLLRTKAGTLLMVEDSAAPILEGTRLAGAVTIFMDITERRASENALRESEKLAAVGRLASSIAHEINNPLAAVTNLLYLMQSTSLSNDTQLYLEQAQAELARVNQIASETLRFHRASTRAAPTNLADVIESVLRLHEGRLKATRVSVERRYRQNRPLLCFPSELRQLIANLIGNAIDAMHGADPARDCDCGSAKRMSPGGTGPASG